MHESASTFETLQYFHEPLEHRLCTRKYKAVIKFLGWGTVKSLTFERVQLAAHIWDWFSECNLTVYFLIITVACSSLTLHITLVEGPSQRILIDNEGKEACRLPPKVNKTKNTVKNLCPLFYVVESTLPFFSWGLILFCTVNMLLHLIYQS